MKAIRNKVTNTEQRLQQAVLDGDGQLIKMLQAKLENYYKLLMEPHRTFTPKARIYVDDVVNFRRPKKKNYF